MTDFFVVSTKNDIDSILIDIDVNPVFQWPHFPYRSINRRENRGGDAPQPGPNRKESIK
jgi:hypothetical protein